jgi:hypothetical protein
MRTLAILTVACAVGCAQDFEQTWRGERLTIRVRAGAIGNLAWQLDTLSGHSNTKPKDYEDLWRNDLAWSKADTRQLQQWSTLYERYRRKKTQNRRARSPYPQNYGRFYGNSVAHDYAFRIAALNAPDLAVVRQSYRSLCGRACADSFVKVLQHFWPRFSAWWQQEGISTSSQIIPQVVDKMADFGLGALCESEIRLTAAELPARHEVALDIAVHPKKYLTNYTATVMDNHLLSEVVDDPEVGGPRLPLLIHELTHHFYDFARRGDHTRLVERFVESPESYSMAAYSVLNEALAVSFQLLAEKRLRPPADYGKFISDDDNVYFDLFIAKVGRATAPLVEEWIAAKKSIFDDGFVDAYLRAAGAALGSLRESPRFLLSTRVLIHGPAGKRAKDEFNQAVRGIVGQDEWSDLKASPSLGGVVFLTQADLPQLRHNRGVLPSSIVAAVTMAARIHTTFAFAWQRSPKAAVYFLYGRDEDRLLSTTRSFARGDTPFSGLLATVPGPPTQTH